MWKKLNEREEIEFTAWALTKWKVGEEINITWHPVIQFICHQRTADFWKEQLKEFTGAVENEMQEV